MNELLIQLVTFFKKQPEVRYCYKINSTNVRFDIPQRETRFPVSGKFPKITLYFSPVLGYNISA